MLKRLKRLFILALAVAMTMSSSVISTYALAEKVITGFEVFDINENSLTFAAEDKPELSQLKEMMPDTLNVYINGSSVLEAIEVDWYCVGDDYETSEYFYFQFSPTWDESEYSLSEEIDLLTEAPYIAVFLKADSGISTFAVTNNSNEGKIFDYLTNTMGYNTAAACAIMANIYCESSFVPTNLQNSYEKSLGYTDATYTAAVDDGSYTNFVRDKAGYGLCQWTYWSRKQGLLDYAKEAGTSIGDLYMQLGYFGVEFVGSKAGNYVAAVPNTADGAYDAAYYFCEVFENPSQVADEKSVYRGNLAKNTYWPEYCEKAAPGTPFYDVKETNYFYKPLLWGLENNIVSGTSPTTFSPYDSCTRAQAVAFLWRSQGRPEPTNKNNPFVDVEKGTYYYKAILWAVENNVIAGTSPTTFSPHDTVTRAQFVTFLWRYAGRPEPESTYNPFTDVPSSKYYYKAVLWASENKITAGVQPNLFGSNEDCTRGQVITFLYRVYA